MPTSRSKGAVEDASQFKEAVVGPRSRDEGSEFWAFQVLGVLRFRGVSQFPRWGSWAYTQDPKPYLALGSTCMVSDLWPRWKFER